MNAYLSMLYRDLSCAAAAIVITLIVGMSFVQSTAVAPAGTTTSAAVARQS